MTRIIVSSRLKGGHRRAGLFIPDSQTELTVTDEQLARIKADRQLVYMVPAATAHEQPAASTPGSAPPAAPPATPPGGSPADAAPPKGKSK